jgi:hypothetical protein
MSYGLLKATERLVGNPLVSYPRYTDQRHTLSIVGDVDLQRGWRLNLRFAYGSGYPYTPMVAQYDAVAGSWKWNPREKNSAYLPPYKRVDGRVSKEFAVALLKMIAFLDISNILNFDNIQSYRYTFNGNGSPKREEVNLWPIVPTLGLTVTF